MLLLAAAFTQEFDQQLCCSLCLVLFTTFVLPLIFVRKKPYEISGIFYL